MVEREKQAVLQVLNARKPLIPPGMDRAQILDIAASAVVMLELLPPHLYDEAWAMAAEGRVRRVKRGTAGVRAVGWVAERKHMLVSMTDLHQFAQGAAMPEELYEAFAGGDAPNALER